jgi:hypothetical protein
MITIPLSGVSKTKLDAILPQSTGLVSGGLLSISRGNTHTFDLSAGVGVIVDNITDPQNPTILFISWDLMSGVSDPYLSLSDTTFIAIDNTGSVVFSTEEFSDIQRRTLIVIGWNDHQDMTEIYVSQSEPFYVCGAVEQFNDFVESFGAFNINGNNFSVSSGLEIQRSYGKVFDGNSNYFTDARTPHVLTTELENPVEVVYYFRDGLGGWVNNNTLVSEIDPNHWDNGSGILQNVPVDKFTIQLISFYAPYIANDVQYGQVVYDTLAEAETAIKNSVEINPYNSFDVFRAWLLIKQGTTDLSNTSNAKFIPAGKLGMMDVSSGGGAGGEVNTASNIGLVGVGMFNAKVGVDLQFKNLNAASSKITVTNNPTNKTVDLDVVAPVESTTTIGTLINGADAKATPVDADMVGLMDSAASNILKKLSWTNIKATLKTYFDTLYPAIGAAAAFFTPANPTAITLATFRMFGLGSTIKITPLKTGKVRFTINYYPSGTGTAGTNSYKICYGTGAAPANGVAASGTVVGRTDAGGTVIQVSGTPAAIVRDVIITGLTPGTAYWFDVQGARHASNSSCSMASIEATLEELPY